MQGNTQLLESAHAKLLYVACNDLSLPNGPGVNEREFLHVLARKYGHNLTYVIPTPKNCLEVVEGSKGILVRRSFALGPFSHLVNQVHIFRSLLTLLRVSSFDLVIFRSAYMPWDIYLLHRFFRFKYVLKTVGLGGDTLAALGGWRGELAKILSKPNQFFSQKVMASAVAVDACTEQLVDNVSNRYGISRTKISHIENATNIQRFFPGDPLAAKKELGLERFNLLVGYVGGSPSLRGGSELVEVLPDLLLRFPDLGVLIVGFDDGLKRLGDRAKALGVEDSVVFAGGVPYSEVQKYICALDVGIAFDDQKKLKITGNSNQKIRQYISAGKPVVVSYGGNVFVSENDLGDTIEHDNPERLVESISRWLSLSSEEKKKHENTARAYAVKHLSVENALCARLEFWQRCLKENDL